MMKITKWIVGLSSLVVCQEAFPDSPFEGVRACLQGGYGTLDTKIQFTRTDTVPIGKDTSVLTIAQRRARKAPLGRLSQIQQQEIYQRLLCLSELLILRLKLAI
jgi:hypothetical protein